MPPPITVANWQPADPGEAARRCGEDVHLWLLSLDEPPWPPGLLLDSLSADERERAQHFRFAADRRRFEMGRGLLRQLLGVYAGSEPAALSFLYAARGKPSLASRPGCEPIYFNLSHSGGWALLALSRAHVVGVDLEFLRDINEMHAIAGQNFASSEVRALLGLPGALRMDAFFACWTRKEALVKAIGDGLAMPLERFEVSVDPRLPAQLRAIDGSAAAAEQWTLHGLRPLAGAWGALAVRGRSVMCKLLKHPCHADQSATLACTNPCK
jgi:4'-phosphopantetheinyl transferase